MNIDSAAEFVGETVLGSLDTGAAHGGGGVCARAADQGFRKRGESPAIAAAVEVAGPEMISVEDILGAANGDDAVAAVRDDLQPGLEIPAKRTHRAVEVGRRSAAVVHASEGVGTVEFDQRRSSATTRVRPLPG